MWAGEVGAKCLESGVNGALIWCVFRVPVQTIPHKILSQSLSGVALSVLCW